MMKAMRKLKENAGRLWVSLEAGVLTVLLIFSIILPCNAEYLVDYGVNIIDYGSITNYVETLEDRLRHEKNNRTNVIETVVRTVTNTITEECSPTLWERWDEVVTGVGVLIICLLIL